jgi:hypothetical protein
MCLNLLNAYAGVVISAYMEEFNSLTVVELKQFLREQSLTVSGKKSELISRLEEPHEEFLVIDETVVATKERNKF